jgi:translation initiation factor IF-1
VAKQEDQILLDGIILETLPGALFRVQIRDNHVVLGHISGKMRQHKIQILEGDRVHIEFSPYDLSRGRIVYREK